MPIQTTGFHHIALRITGLARSRAFYVDTLGFPTVVGFPGTVIVNAHGTLLGLRESPAETPSSDHFDPYRVGLDHIALGVADPGALVELPRQLNSAGVPNNGIEDDPTMGAQYISFHDPDGIAW